MTVCEGERREVDGILCPGQTLGLSINLPADSAQRKSDVVAEQTLPHQRHQAMVTRRVQCDQYKIRSRSSRRDGYEARG